MSPRTMRHRLRQLLVKTTRLSAYLGVLAVGLTAFGARVVHAKGERVALAIAEPLSGLDLPSGGGTVLTVNGKALHLASAHLDAKLGDVLDRAQKACETHADGLADDLGEIETAFGRAPSTRGFPGISILRDQREGRGVVACFAPGERSGPTATLRRLERFAKSHDLADLGGLRYVAAHTDDLGGTRVVATWADGRMNLDDLLPAEGDAPGDDPSAAPRPEGARRLLSARVMPAPYGAFLYTTPAAPDAALATYERALTARGFRAVDASGNGRAYQAGLVDVMVTAVGGRDGTTLSIIESHFSTVKGASR